MKISLWSTKSKLILAGSISTVAVVTTAIAVPVALLVPGSQAAKTSEPTAVDAQPSFPSAGPAKTSGGSGPANAPSEPSQGGSATATGPQPASSPVVAPGTSAGNSSPGTTAPNAPPQGGETTATGSQPASSPVVAPETSAGNSSPGTTAPNDPTQGGETTATGSQPGSQPSNAPAATGGGGSGADGTGTGASFWDDTTADDDDDGIGVYTNPDVAVLTPDQQKEKAAFLKKYPHSMNDDSSIAMTAFMNWGNNSSISNRKFPDDFALPSFVNWIGIYAFANAKLNASFVLPDSVTWIGGAAFLGATLPPNFRLPKSLEVIYVGAFAGQKFSDGFTIGPNVLRLGMWRNDEDGEVNGGKALDYASPFAFATFGSDFTLPDTLYDIADTTFSGSGLKAYAKNLAAEGGIAPGLAELLQINDLNSTVPLGFHIPDTTWVWTYDAQSRKWTHSFNNALKVNIPDNCKWDDPRGGVSGATVVLK